MVDGCCWFACLLACFWLQGYFEKLPRSKDCEPVPAARQSELEKRPSKIMGAKLALDLSETCELRRAKASAALNKYPS